MLIGQVCNDAGVRKERAEDAAMFAWAALWRYRDDVDADTAKGWLRVVARNEVRRDARRREVYLGAVPELEASRDDALLELREALTALLRLPPAQRMALIAIALGVSYAEVGVAAGSEGLPKTWANRNAQRGRRKLREALGR